jgi:hypothetical protein
MNNPLLDKLEAKVLPYAEWNKLSTGPMIKLSDVKAIVNEALEGMTLVPDDDFNMAVNTAVNILNLAGDVSSESIEEMASHIADTLLASSKGIKDE